jgi:hypothetical protein
MKKKLLQTKEARQGRARYRQIVAKVRRMARGLGLKSIWCGPERNLISVKQLKVLRAEKRAKQSVA